MAATQCLVSANIGNIRGLAARTSWVRFKPAVTVKFVNIRVSRTRAAQSSVAGTAPKQQGEIVTAATKKC